MTTNAAYNSSSDAGNMPPQTGRRHTARRVLLGALLALALILIAGRVYLPIWLTDYVNKTLDNIPGYSGSVRDVDVALLRGAYVIHDLKLLRTVKDIPVPFLDIRKSDLSLQWGALFNGEIVGDVTLYNPVINFAVGRSGQTAQTGANTDWTVPIKELMPLDINFLEINNGRLSYKDFSTAPNIDLFIEDLFLRATNIRNVEEKSAALPSALVATGKSIGGGDLRIDGNMNILRRIPDLSVKGKLEKVSLPAMNNYARAFAGIDFNSGNLDIYTDLNVKDGKVSGFVKPLARNIDLIDPEKEGGNPLNLLWESLVSVVLEVFENQPRDQVATQIPLEGSIDSPDTDFWATLNGILKNAFVKAYTNTVKPE